MTHRKSKDEEEKKENKSLKEENKQTASSENSQKKENKDFRNFVIAAIILVVLFFGTIAINNYFNEKRTSSNDYNNFRFYYDDNNNYWVTQIELHNRPYQIPFHYHPTELEEIIVQEGVEDIILADLPEKILITVPRDSGSDIALAGIEISKLTGTRFQVFKINTSTAVNEPMSGLPYATCANATENITVISFERGQDNIVTGNNNCIHLKFQEGDPIKVADAFAYHLLKIM